MAGLIDRASVLAASERIGAAVRRTPCMVPGNGFGETPDTAKVVLKLELLQHTGSFKARGALNRALTSDIPPSGLIAASGGNHGLAVAWTARQLGVPAEIFVPEVSPETKVRRLHELGATVHVEGALYDDALQACRARGRETGALDIHAYDHVDTVTATATVGTEIDEQTGVPDTVLVALGGGGLAAGIAAWYRDTATRVITVEPETSNCYAAAVAGGEPVDVAVSGAASDSLGAARVGSIPWRELRAASADPVTVSDSSIRDAQDMLWRELRLVAEPGGAAAMAALASGAYRPTDKESVVVIVCGANCDPADIADRAYG